MADGGTAPSSSSCNSGRRQRSSPSMPPHQSLLFTWPVWCPYQRRKSCMLILTTDSFPSERSPTRLSEILIFPHSRT